MGEDRPADSAARQAIQDAIEQERLKLDVARLRLERQKIGIDALLRRRELRAPKSRGLKDLFANPLALAIVGGFITVMTTTITGAFNTSQTIRADTAKARQALQTDLIKKFVDSPEPQKVRANLQFLVDVGLVPDYSASLSAFLDRAPDSALPSSSNAASSALPALHTDDDAIDLVIRWEGGYADIQGNPALSSKYGIDAATLGQFLGRPPSGDDLRDLPVDTARAIYKQHYLTGAVSGLTSVQVKAAYIGLATSLGPARAAGFFLAALGKIDNRPVAEGRSLTPEDIQRINAVEPDLLIETVNCEAARYYQSEPIFSNVGKALIRRLLTFSPVTLKGICPDLLKQPDATPQPPAP